jgi:AcrR family transcriptional regulator
MMGTMTDASKATASANSRTNPTAGGAAQRQHILDIALSLMAQRGVDGTSMRDLATAAGLNVASLYHYFPSKRDLLVAVLDEQGFLDDLAATDTIESLDETGRLVDLLSTMLSSMLEVEDFVRLMLGEVLRGDETAHGVGVELFAVFQQSLESWLTENRPDLCQGPGAPAVARMLRAMMVGLFFEHVAGMLEGEPGDAADVFNRRSQEVAEILSRVDPTVSTSVTDATGA